jgi:D-aminopeptidase
MPADAQALSAVLASWAASDAPGLVASVVHRGRTLLCEARGLAHLDAGLLNQPSTRLRIGSTSKHFAALLVLMLCEEGRLSLDDPVTRWLPELDPSQRVLTLHRLLTHTGGARDYLDLSMLSNGKACLPEAGGLALQCLQRGTNFEPGTRHLYSNGGYRLIGLVLERVTGMPLAQLMRERLFEPLGMGQTAHWPSDLLPLPGLAASHLAQPGGGFHKSLFPGFIMAEGGIVSTADDMQRWLAHLLEPRLWPQRLSDALIAPTRLANGHPSPYGLGLVRETWRGVELVHHAGGVIGGSSQMLAAPAQGLRIVVLSNRSDLSAMDVAQRLLVAALGDALAPPPARFAATDAQGWAGEYLAEDGSALLTLSETAEGPALQPFGIPAALPLHSAGEGWAGLQFHGMVDMALRLHRGADSGSDWLEVREQGRTDRYQRIGSPPPGVLQAFAGRWIGDEFDAEVGIGRPAADAMHVRGRYGTTHWVLQPLAESVCRLTSTDPALPMSGLLQRADDGAVPRLVVHSGRTRGLVLRAHA